MTRLSRLVVISSCLWLSACAVGPDYRAPVTAQALPDRYAAAPDSAMPAPERWWTLFGDPTLNALVERALRSGPDIAMAEARVRESRARFAMAGGVRWPQLNTGARLGRDQMSRNSESLANLPLPNPRTGFTDYRAGFDASWEIDLFGRLSRGVEAAGARMEGSEAARQDAALRVAAEVARNAADVRAWTLRRENGAEAVADSRDLLRLTELQRRAGWLSDREVDEASAALADQEAALPVMDAARHASLAALSVLVDEPVERLAIRFEGTAPFAVPEAIPAGLPSELLRRRADVRAAERALAAATADIGAAVAEQYPRLTLVGSGGWDSIYPGRLTESASRFWNAGPQLTLPLFAGGRLKAQVDAREAERDAAFAAYRKAVLSALADVETALARCKEEAVRDAGLSRALAAREALVGQTERRAAVGESARSEVLAARIQRRAAGDALLASRQTRAAAMIALFKALGGGFGD
ncbi:efflux transporter outer membrane subunit [Paludibacterium paludis]|uniref:RND transporter n=1 Tax=Paludibacterium paludis TaxID=1225769 RepID=A0A918P4P4_9NEIS|nr:efflux transporter outer membrane subunit [Paludibacterium paludis]GGY19848.1 RND transporter [Paludibacterium paludis]